MQIHKSEYYRLNGDTWDLYLFRTTADLVAETSEHKIMTDLERIKIAENLEAFNGADQLLKLDSGGRIPVGLFPGGGGGYLPTEGGTMTGDLNLGNNDIVNVKSITKTGSIAKIDFSTLNRLIINERYTFTNNALDMGGGKIQAIADPVNKTDAVNRQWVEQLVAQGTHVVGAVRVASTGPITELSGASKTVDGVNLVRDDRILVKNQESPSQNGVYIVSANGWTKLPNDSDRGSLVFVLEGNTNKGSQFYNTNGVNWETFFVQDTYHAAADGGLELDYTGFGFKVKEEGITNDMLAGDIAWDKMTDLPGNGPVKVGIATPWSSFVEPIEQDNPLEVRIQKMLEIMQKIRGTEDLLTNSTQSISDAYAKISLKSRISSGSTVPPTSSGYDSGDVYLKILSST